MNYTRDHIRTHALARSKGLVAMSCIPDYVGATSGQGDTEINVRVQVEQVDGQLIKGEDVVSIR